MMPCMRHLLCCSLLLYFSACAFLQPRPANDLYILHADTHASGRFVPVNLVIAPPILSPGLDTSRIAVLKASNNISYYNGVAWAQPAGELLQTFLVDALGQSHLFKSVSSDKEGTYADMVLSADVQDFEVDKSKFPALIRIRMTVKLINANSHIVIATIPVQKTVSDNGSGMEGVVVAFNKAMNAIALSLVNNINSLCGAGVKDNANSCTQ